MIRCAHIAKVECTLPQVIVAVRVDDYGDAPYDYRSVEDVWKRQETRRRLPRSIQRSLANMNAEPPAIHPEALFLRKERV